MKQTRKRLTYANVTSSLALFLVLAGGTAIAANGLAKNSVGARQIKPNAVTEAKIRDGAVSPAKLSSASKATLVGSQGPQGPQGPQGLKGDRGPTGDAGSALAFVEVHGFNGSIVGERAKNITSANVSKGTNNGVICFKDLAFDWKNVVAIRQGGTGDAGTVNYVLGTGGVCPAGTEITVTSLVFSGGAFTASANDVMIVFN